MITMTITGRLCYDPKVREVGDKTVTEVTIASKYKQETIFVDVSVWGSRGSVVQQYMRKGDTATFVGKMMPLKVKNGNAYIHVDSYDFTLPPRRSDAEPAEVVHYVQAKNEEELPF